MAVNVISSSICPNVYFTTQPRYGILSLSYQQHPIVYWLGIYAKYCILFFKTKRFTSIESCNCGKANDDPTKSVSGDYIDGGLETSKNKYPWVVSFRRVSKQMIKHDEKGYMFNRNLGCTGALLDTKHVLIAAHCIYKEEFYKWNIHGILILCIMKDSLDINTM